MFGDRLIIGQSLGKLDSKNRIFIPPFTSVSVGDDVIIKTDYCENEIALKIYTFNNYLQIIERLKTLRSNTADIEEIKKYTNQIEQICIQLESLVKVDRQKRILISKSIISKTNWQPGDTVLFSGLGDSLLVRKNKS